MTPFDRSLVRGELRLNMRAQYRGAVRSVKAAHRRWKREWAEVVRQLRIGDLRDPDKEFDRRA